MTLQLIEGDRGSDESGETTSPNTGERRLAPGAPVSPGTVPLELAQQLRTGEALVWWGYKDRVSFKPVLWTLLAGAVVLGGVSLFAPELWRQPFASLWKPIAAIFSPALLVYLREYLSLRHLAVTDTSVIEVTQRGRADRIAFRNVDRVGRDLLTGGILLVGQAHRVRVPPTLMDDTRAAIASQTRGTIRGATQQPSDPLGWLP